jgi:hypothetical protein
MRKIGKGKLVWRDPIIMGLATALLFMLTDPWGHWSVAYFRSWFFWRHYLRAALLFFLLFFTLYGLEWRWNERRRTRDGPPPPPT